MPIIEVRDISKVYPLRQGTRLLLGRGGLGDFLKGKNKSGGFNALKDVSLEVDAGESLGIIGRNGSGKSTLLKILAGVTLPSSGTVRVEGRVASLLELGAGFHPMLTGRENIYLNAGLLGMRAAQVDEVFNAIVAFSGIAEFIDQPVDTYSSGMYVRIAFSVAVHANPDIFLVDEVLAVGDEEFQRRCRVKIGELKEQGKTIVFVSHDLGMVHALCDRVALMHQGGLVRRETPQQTIDFYLRQIGRESGIHTMNMGELDVIFNHGKISLFRKQQEISATAGAYLSFYSMGQEHFSTHADWKVTDSGPAHCTAEGRMSRLSAMLHLNLRLEGETLSVACALEPLGETAIDIMGMRFQAPGAYGRYFMEDVGHRLPEMQPGDVDWSIVLKPDAHCRQALLLDDNNSLPPLGVRFEGVRSYAMVQVYNCDYISGARILECATHIPSTESRLKPGPIEIGSMHFDLGLTKLAALEMAQQWESRRRLNLGACNAWLDNGFITLEAGQTRITHDGHLHLQLRLGNMWVISRMFQWSQAWEEDGWVLMSGTSARAPFTIIWAVCAKSSGLQWRIYLETSVDSSIQEYNVSAALVKEYSAWEKVGENGDFPAFRDGHEWVHLNADFSVSDLISAHGEGLPKVSLRALPDSPALRMSALNTGCGQESRVLQAMRASDRESALHFSPGKHLLFDGIIEVGNVG